MGICDDATKLVKEAKRNLSTIRPFEDQLVRNIIHTVQDRYSEFQKMIPSSNSQSDSSQNPQIPSSNPVASTSTPSSTPNPPTPLARPITKYMILCLKRFKRALLIYFNTRIRTILPKLWQDSSLVLSNTSPDSNNSASIHSNLHLSEVEFSKNYHNLITRVSQQFCTIELLGDITPPKKVMVEVRVLENAGSIMTEYGMVNLIKDSQILVRLSDVEGLINRGLVERIE